MSDFKFPYEAPALRVEQRLNRFYVAVLPAELLLQVAFSDRMSAVKNVNGGYTLQGTQRPIQEKRLIEISEYINRTDSAFPNSIIVAANYDRNTGFDQGEVEDISLEEGGRVIDESHVWKVVEFKNGCHKLIIPSSKPLAAIIDGQHRLFSFARADIDALRDTSLPCSVFMDLPKAHQAQIFATINSTQKPVNRSLTYELFGYNISAEDEEYWTPDKLAVFFTRKLATDNDSPLLGQIVIAPKLDSALEALAAGASWRVSTAVVVDGILRLYSSNPKRDANIMRSNKVYSRSILRTGLNDRSPLRDVFIEGNDLLIYTAIVNYLFACKKIFWSRARGDSFILRTIGVQAIFDILRKIALDALEKKDISIDSFEARLIGAKDINFSEDRFRNPSGSGRTIIRREIEGAIGLE